MTTSTDALIDALRILADDIQCGVGVRDTAIAEAADRLEVLQEALRQIIKHQKMMGGGAFAGYSTTVLIAERALNHE